MKLLFDQNPSAELCGRLQDVFPGSAQTGSPGLVKATDAAVWSAARDGGFILVAQDADFSEMAALLGPPPKVVWLRCGNSTTSAVAGLLRRHRPTIAEFVADARASCSEIG